MPRKRTTPAAATASLTVSYADGRIVLECCGLDPLSPAEAVYTHPDGTTETRGIGVWNDEERRGCLDTNYLLADASGAWSVAVSQAGTVVATGSVTLP